ncbi:MAG TPA: hypothetical protein VGC85_04265 [Chthoniobacterales bacterium]
MASKRIIALSIALTVVASCARGDWRFDAETGSFYDSNLSNSDRAAEQEHDWSWQTRIRAANGFQLTRDLRLTLSGDVVGALWHEYSGFDQIGGGATALLRYRFGLGREAPWVAIENRVGYDAFEETFRDGWSEAAHVRGGFSLSERLRVEAGYTYENSCTRSEDVWSWCAHRGDIALIIDVTSQLQVAIGYGYRYGDVISYAIPPRPDLRAIATARDEENLTFDEPRTAYKVDGRTHAATLSASYALTKHVALQVGYEYRNTAHDALEYENHLVSAKLAFGF